MSLIVPTTEIAIARERQFFIVKILMTGPPYALSTLNVVMIRNCALNLKRLAFSILREE
jgi:hypothetical protein